MTKTKSPIALYHSQGEAIMASKLLAEIINRGFAVTIDNGVEISINNSTNRAKIMNKMGATDEDLLIIKNPNGKVAGWFRLIYGNDPCELINDHSGKSVCYEICERLESLGV